jgi:hypothetical protein
VTPTEWQEHAAKCREVAAAIEDDVARRVLLEAADDYLLMAEREETVRRISIPAYQIDARHRAKPSRTRNR